MPNPPSDQGATRWTIIRRRDWPHDHGSLIAHNAPIPEPDDKLEVIEVVPKAERDIYRRALQRILDDDSRDSRDAMLVAAKAIGDGNMLQNTLTPDENREEVSR